MQLAGDEPFYNMPGALSHTIHYTQRHPVQLFAKLVESYTVKSQHNETDHIVTEVQP